MKCQHSIFPQNQQQCLTAPTFVVVSVRIAVGDVELVVDVFTGQHLGLHEWLSGRRRRVLDIVLACQAVAERDAVNHILVGDLDDGDDARTETQSSVTCNETGN